MLIDIYAAGILSYDAALNMTTYLVNETESTPWQSALTALHYIDEMLIADENYDVFKVLSRITNNYS